MKNLTLDKLINAIRKAEDLKELKQLVGPSQAEIDKAEARMAEMDKLWEKYYLDAEDQEAIPYQIRQKYDELNMQQSEFESQFC